MKKLILKELTTISTTLALVVEDFNNFKLGMSDTKRDMLSLCDELVTIPRYQGDDNDMLAPIDTLSKSNRRIINKKAFQ